MIQPVSIIRVLIQITKSDDPKYIWQESDEGRGSQIEVNGVRVEFATITRRIDSLLCLNFGLMPHKISIVEPESDSLIRKKYNSMDKKELVMALHELQREIAAQHERMQKFREQHNTEIQQDIFSKLLNG